jgi:hypothetical protein
MGEAAVEKGCAHPAGQPDPLVDDQEDGGPTIPLPAADCCTLNANERFQYTGARRLLEVEAGGPPAVGGGAVRPMQLGRSRHQQFQIESAVFHDVFDHAGETELHREKSRAPGRCGKIVASMLNRLCASVVLALSISPCTAPFRTIDAVDDVRGALVEHEVSPAAAAYVASPDQTAVCLLPFDVLRGSADAKSSRDGSWTSSRRSRLTPDRHTVLRV